MDGDVDRNARNIGREPQSPERLAPNSAVGNRLTGDVACRMRILGVDPGTMVTGYGVIDVDGEKLTLVDYGVVKMTSAMTLPARLERIYTSLAAVIEATLPDEFAIESAFYSKNVQSTLKLGHARGVSILAAQLRQIPTAEYAPSEVKRSVTGNGNASKEQVEYMVMALLAMKEQTHLLDATDALAIALCHGRKIHSPRSRSRSWEQFVADHPNRVLTGR
jgi:crossover junction endodeoxyribonuclease RuvC